MTEKFAVAILLAALAAALPAPASAASQWHGDIRHFHDRDAHHWATGHWYHGRHGDRLGWWWVVGAAVCPEGWKTVPAAPADR